MPVPQINITLGTAGHIDHGKTALVKSLTGCETDRLKEEKERGMTIDLGYAPCTIADMEVGIVDVPGHENFIKTMVAGAHGMDGVILVVAADDGIMPQTREHLEILTLLGLRHGLVALTKIDRVDADHRALVRADLAGLLQGTFLAGAPIVGVSNVTGEGFDEFYEALWALIRGIQPRRSDGVFRVPLDRAFSAAGYGTVVAGIPISGEISIGDEVVLLPQQWIGQVRRIEAYGRTNDTARAGQCVAMNVGHWDYRNIVRGDTLTLPDYFRPQQWFLCDLRLLPHERLTLKSGAHVAFHAGTSAVAASIYPVSGDHLEGGQQCLVQIHTQHPLVAGPGDSFLVRTPSPVRTIGGGRIVEALPRRLKRGRPDFHEDLRQRAAAVGDDLRFVEYCLRTAETLAAGTAEIAARAKVPRTRVREMLEAFVQQQKALAFPAGLYLHRDTAATASQRLVDLVAAHHRQTPQSPGVAPDQLRQTAALEKAVFDGLLGLLKKQGRLVESQQRLATADHRPAFPDADLVPLEAIETLYRSRAMQPPTAEELAASTRLAPPVLERLVRLLCEHGRLVKVADGLLFHRDAVQRARELLVAHLEKEGRLESVQFKYILDTTRKFAIPLLDYFDRVGATRRVGNTRYPKVPPRPAGPS